MTWQKPPSLEFQTVDNAQPKSIEQLFQRRDFLVDLRTANPFLTGYLGQHPQLVRQSIRFITEMPDQSDSEARKFQYPLMTVQMVETGNPAVIQCMALPFQESQPLIGQVLARFQSPETITPLLGGYMLRVVNSVIKQKPVQTLQYVYSKFKILKALLDHSYNKSAQVILQSLLNVDYLKDRPTDDKLKIRLDVVTSALGRLHQNIHNPAISSNICDLLIDIVERHHLIADGIRMSDIILSEPYIKLYFAMLGEESITRLLKAIANHYCMSLLNVEEAEPKLNLKNLESLERLPYVRVLCSNAARMTPSSFSYSSFRVLQILCHSLCIRSVSVFHAVRETNFFPLLLQLFFSNQSNILHNLAQKTLSYVLNCDKSVYKAYREHLFCEVDILRLTAGRVQNLKLGELMGKSYGGCLVKIIQALFKVRTQNPKILSVLQSNQGLLTKWSSGVLKMYQQIVSKDLGTFQVQQQSPITNYKVTRVLSAQRHPSHQVPVASQTGFAKQTKQVFSSSLLSEANLVSSLELEEPTQKQANQQEIPITSSPSLSTLSLQTPTFPKRHITIQLPVDPPSYQPVKSSRSFDEFMRRASINAQEAIKLKRQSAQKQRRSTPVSKGLSLTKSKHPWVNSPMARSIIIPKSPTLKNTNPILVKMAASPQKESESRRFRTIQNKDLALLNFLGINLGK